MIQVQNIAAGLAEADPEHAEIYQKNAESYIARLTALSTPNWLSSLRRSQAQGVASRSTRRLPISPTRITCMWRA